MTNPIDRENLRPKFWENHPLEDLSKPEWEALCDGCGRCCLLKLEDEDTQEIRFTNVVCRLFNEDNCRCSQYALRQHLVPTCVILTPENIERSAHWMPKTCAYRLLQQGDPLPCWHPLVTGDPDSVQQAGISLQGKIIPEYDVDEDDLEDYTIEGVI